MSVRRIISEKKPEFAVEAKQILHDVSADLDIRTIDNVRVLNQYDVEGITDEEYENANDFFEMSVDAFEVELGRDDPVTNGTKLVNGFSLMFRKPIRAFGKIQEAMFDNSIAPNIKRINNMEEANILLESALDGTSPRGMEGAESHAYPRRKRSFQGR